MQSRSFRSPFVFLKINVLCASNGGAIKLFTMDDCNVFLDSQLTQVRTINKIKPSTLIMLEHLFVPISYHAPFDLLMACFISPRLGDLYHQI